MRRPLGEMDVRPLVLAAVLWAASPVVWGQAGLPRGLDIDQHSGVVGAIDRERHSLQVNGQRLEWHPERLKVVHELTGKPVPLERLRAGMRVRYALEPMGGRGALRIVTLYLQEAR